MTSGNFATVLIKELFVNRETRQRKVLEKIDELAESINLTGLIHPIVVTREGRVVAGERRWEACKLLGWTAIPVQYTDQLTEEELQLIELEENLKRLDICWQDEVLAISKYHEIKSSSATDWDMGDTASTLGIGRKSIGDKLLVASELLKNNKTVTEAKMYSVAQGLTVRLNKRKKDSELETIQGDLFSKPEVPTIAATISVPSSISKEENWDATPVIPLKNVDFLDWIKTYSGVKFNFLHCDFPYGINIDGTTQGNAVQSQQGYEDTENTYWNLIHGLDYLNTRGHIAKSAHMIFWFSMKYYEDTKNILESMGWTVLYTPLIWHKSDNTGIIPDVNRGPRQTYETAFFCSRGDRQIVRAKANSFSSPTTKLIHMSEKPKPVLTHFFNMLIDETTVMLDPTCGSATAVVVARQLKAKSVLGLEINTELCIRAVDNFYTGIE